MKIGIVGAGIAGLALANLLDHARDEIQLIDSGFAKDYRVSELFWPARLFRTAPVSEEMILNYVANNILGMRRFY
ncbi:NAD(P)-binding protein [Corynebacterium macclintockiae]|uniref:NAD(P)-binding protein n=1 Tax=Corynebacterium macclintockiae TaxID=2913501 RepID=UPI003EC0362D